MKARILTAAAFMTLVASPAMAGIQDFTVTNETGQPITHVYVSEADNEDWEDDVLGKDVLEDGDETEITFDGYGEDVCKFDVKVTMAGGKSWIVSDVDLCSTHAIAFKLKGGKLTYTKK